MKIVQDKLRNRQALLVSGLITLIFTSLFLFIIYEQRIAAASEGVNRLQARMMDIFNDNELIADAIGERYHHIKTGEQCGEISQFVPRNEDEWGINADPKRLHSATGTIIAQRTSHNALCMYTAAEFIRGMVNELNPGASMRIVTLSPKTQIIFTGLWLPIRAISASPILKWRGISPTFSIHLSISIPDCCKKRQKQSP